jgi:hypothetical protein
MTELHPCPECDRHVAIAETTCPFCRHELRPGARRVEAPRRLSRAAVFAATLATAGCGGKAKRNDPEMPVEREVQNHPCSEPNPAEIERLEKQREEATTDEEKHALDEQIERAKQPMCAPYGAPPARRRVV